MVSYVRSMELGGFNMPKRLPQNGICPVATTISLLNSQWKILIMKELLKKTERYSELEKNVAGISQKMLTQSLHELENDGLIHREVFPEVPPHVEYSLTELGNSMRPILQSMHNWGVQYLKKHPQKITES
mgnify:CR=1 FL=1